MVNSLLFCSMSYLFYKRYVSDRFLTIGLMYSVYWTIFTRFLIPERRFFSIRSPVCSYTFPELY